jgi:hypothetical protein
LGGDCKYSTQKLVEEINVGDGYMGIMSGRIGLNYLRREDQ